MKKVVIAILLIILAIFALSACGGDDPKECTHQNLKITEGRRPTCTKKGLTEGKTCLDCGKVLQTQESIKKIDHDYELISSTPACTSEGEALYRCSDCNDEYTETLPAGTHDLEFFSTLTPASCFSSGLEIQKCKNCDHQENVVVPQLEHNMVVSKTEEIDGIIYITKECENGCGKQEFEEVVVDTDNNSKNDSDTDSDLSTDSSTETDTDKPIVDNCFHDWVFTVTTANCTSAGKTVYTCSKCKETNTTAATALGHDFQKTKTIDPTCQTKGYDLYECSRNCGVDPEKRNEFPTSITGLARYHNYVEDTNAITPTCVDFGYSQKICEYCKTVTDRKTFPALGHTFERTYQDGEINPTEVISVSPTCEVNGQITYYCADCDELWVLTYEWLTREGATVEDLALAETIKALGHDYAFEIEKVFPTCLTSGYLVMGCDNGCGETIMAADYAPLGHTYERDGVTEYSYKVILLPTCISQGSEWVVCDDCGYCSFDDEVKDEANSREIPATGEHVFDIITGGIFATCTEEGYSKYRCSADAVCCETENRDFVEPLGHNWILDESLLTNGLPTCLTEGNWPYYCDGHNSRYGCLENATCYNANGETPLTIRHCGYIKGDFYTEPTCISPATYLCADCYSLFEAYHDDEYAQPTGMHNYTILDTVVEPTCHSYGYTVYCCSNDIDCQETEIRDITARAPHTFSEISAVGSMACFECGMAFMDVNANVEYEFKDGQVVVISQEATRACGPYCAGPEFGCEIHDVLIFVTATTPPDEPFLIEPHNSFYYEVDYEKPVHIIRLTDDMMHDYYISFYDIFGNAIYTYDANGEDVSINIYPPYYVDGSVYIDISEISQDVAYIEITSYGEATVSFYTTSIPH